MQNKIGIAEQPTCGACKHYSCWESDGWCLKFQDDQRDDDPWASKCSAFERHPDSKTEGEP